MTLTAMLAELPQHCDVGVKRNAKGHQESWIGYKLHIDSADGGIPISCVLTSASVHDSQFATMTAERVNGGLKDHHGGRTVQVRGPVKLMCHPMFGVFCLTALQLLRLVI